MPLALDVTLPRDVAPVFPDACCACGRDQPGDSVTIKGRRINWAELFLPWLWFFGKRVRVTVPVCAACRPRLLASRRWNNLILVVNLVAACAVAMPLAKSFGFARGTTRMLSLAFVFVGALPWLLWTLFHPVLFDITVHKETIDYEFAHRGYAIEFFAANDRATSADLPPHPRRIDT
jgi:fatty acid desaturase